jgi:hypothetical protein
VGLVKSVEGLKRKDGGGSEEEGILPPDLGLKTATLALPRVSRLRAHPVNFRFTSPHHHRSRHIK